MFGYLADRGEVSREDMEATFNMGVGMVAVVSPQDRDRALAMLTARHIDAWELGTVRNAREGEDDRVVLGGTHRGY